jgi:hypothetical protein
MLLQVMARVVSHGPDGRMLNGTFREADKLEYQQRQLCCAVLRAVSLQVMARVVSHGPDCAAVNSETQLHSMKQ